MTRSELTSTSRAGAGSNPGPIPGARNALLLLLLINLFNYIDRQILAAVVPAIRDEFFKDSTPAGPFMQTILDRLGSWLGSNPENAFIGLLAMAFMVSYMLAAPLFGWLPWRKWWIVALGVVLWSLASGASGLATGFAFLLATRCLVGVGEAAYGPVAPAMIADYYPVASRGRVMSLLYLAMPVGSALGFALGGLLADSSFGWRWAFYAVVPPGVLLGFICLFMKEPASGQADAVVTQGHTRPRWRDLAVLARTPSYVLDTLGMAAMTFAVGGIAFWMPSYIHEFRGVPDLAAVNLIFGAIVVASGIAGTLAGGLLADRLRARLPGSYFLVSGASMVLGLPAFVATLYVPFPWAWPCLFLACFCLFLSTGPANTILANVSHPALRPAAYAINIFVIHALGDVISPFIIGAVADLANMTVAFLLVSIMVLVGGLVWLWGARYLAKDTELATQRLNE